MNLNMAYQLSYSSKTKSVILRVLNTSRQWAIDNTNVRVYNLLLPQKSGSNYHTYYLPAGANIKKQLGEFVDLLAALNSVKTPARNNSPQLTEPCVRMGSENYFSGRISNLLIEWGERRLNAYTEMLKRESADLWRKLTPLQGFANPQNFFAACSNCELKLGRRNGYITSSSRANFSTIIRHGELSDEAIMIIIAQLGMIELLYRKQR